MSIYKRNSLYVDPKIRKSIIERIVFYWGACLIFCALPLIIVTTLNNTDRLVFYHIGDLAQRFWPLLLVFMGILPFVIRDALRVTNRTLGPLARMRQELRQYKETGTFNPVPSRECDFLAEFISEINDAIVANQHREAELRLDLKEQVFSKTRDYPLIVPGSPEKSEPLP